MITNLYDIPFIRRYKDYKIRQTVILAILLQCYQHRNDEDRRRAVVSGSYKTHMLAHDSRNYIINTISVEIIKRVRKRMAERVHLLKIRTAQKVIKEYLKELEMT